MEQRKIRQTSIHSFVTLIHQCSVKSILFLIHSETPYGEGDGLMPVLSSTARDIVNISVDAIRVVIVAALIVRAFSVVASVVADFGCRAPMAKSDS